MTISDEQSRTRLPRRAGASWQRLVLTFAGVVLGTVGPGLVGAGPTATLIGAILAGLLIAFFTSWGPPTRAKTTIALSLTLVAAILTIGGFTLVEFFRGQSLFGDRQYTFPVAPVIPDGPTGSAAQPQIEEERVVELSAQPGQESVEIDWWRSVDDGSGDLQMDPQGIYTALGAKLSVIDDEPEPTATLCAQIPTWTVRVDFATLHEGSRLCAQSLEGRYATLQIRALPGSPASNGRFIFYGKTWELGSP